MAFEPIKDGKIGKKRHKSGEIVAKLRQVEVLTAQLRLDYGGVTGDQINRGKELKAGNNRLHRVVSDLVIEKLILKEAAPAPTGQRQENF